MMGRSLHLSDDISESRWIFTLRSDEGEILASHALPPPEGAYWMRALRDLPAVLSGLELEEDRKRQLRELGTALTTELLGIEVVQALVDHPPGPLPVFLPETVSWLASVPLELAFVERSEGEGSTLLSLGIRPCFSLAGAPPRERSKVLQRALRILLIHALPETASPYNLREEVLSLTSQLEKLGEAQQAALDLTVVSYGATRDTLRDALGDEQGYDLIHVLFRGRTDVLMLETHQGEMDRIPLKRLEDGLLASAHRLKLLSVAVVGAPPPDLREERAALGLANPGPIASSAPFGPAGPSDAPSLALGWSQMLECAVVAPRYQLSPQESLSFTEGLLTGLLSSRAPLSDAVAGGLERLLSQERHGAQGTETGAILYAVTPLLFGRNASTLTLGAPWKVPGGEEGLSPLAGFPPRPPCFVGRLKPLMRATLALADDSPYRGVVFHGTVGGGKTACALETVYRHHPARFEDSVFFAFPPDADPHVALVHFLYDLETRLQILGHPMTSIVDDPTSMAGPLLQRLQLVIARRNVLILLDGLEEVLTAESAFASEDWERVISCLISHQGASRVIITTRRLPPALKSSPLLRLEPIHTLPLDEALLLARSLEAERAPALASAGAPALREALVLAQGHPLLTMLRAGMGSGDRGGVEALPALFLGDSASASPEERPRLERFLSRGMTDLSGKEVYNGLTRFLPALLETLPPERLTLLRLLCGLEPADRVKSVMDGCLEPFLEKTSSERGRRVRTLIDPEGVITRLEHAKLLTRFRTRRRWPAEVEEEAWEIHPQIARAVREQAGPEKVLNVAQVAAEYFLKKATEALTDSAPGGLRRGTDALRAFTPYALRTGGVDATVSLAETVRRGEQSTATLALLMALLRAALKGSSIEAQRLLLSLQLAGCLTKLNREAELETLLRALVSACEAAESHSVGADAAGLLVDLLLASGRSEEALKYVTLRAGLLEKAGAAASASESGSSRELAVAGQRLQALADQGRYEEVVGAVRDLVVEEKTGGGPGGAGLEREKVLLTGREAALRSSQWTTALKLTEEVVASMRQRGAGDAEVMRARVDDYWPLLKQQGYDDARGLLQDCRTVLEPLGNPDDLGRVHAALADLEDAVGHAAAASWLAQTALRHAYVAGDPEKCVLVHANLAGYLERRGGAADQSVAHLLAAGLLGYQSQSSLYETVLQLLVTSRLSDNQPKYEKVVALVEQVKGIPFKLLMENLPSRASDGDAAMKALWEQVLAQRAAAKIAKAERLPALEGLPDAVRAAFAQEGEAFTVALSTALSGLPEEEALSIIKRLESSGLIRAEKAADLLDTLQVLDPLLRGIAEVALGNETLAPRVVMDLTALEAKGWRIAAPVQRIWRGERSRDALIQGLDANSAQVIDALLELLKREEERRSRATSSTERQG